MSDCESKGADFYRVIADSSCCWECWHDLANHLVYSSPSSEQITGYTPQDFYDNPELFFQIIHPDDAERFRRHCANPEPQAEELEFRILHRTGRVCWIGHVCRPLYDDQGELLGRRSTNRDVTRQVELQQQLKNLAQFPQRNPDPVMRLSAEGVILYMNPAAVEIFASFDLAPGQTGPEPFRTLALKAHKTGRLAQEIIDCGQKKYWLTFTAVEEDVNVYGRDCTERQKTQEGFRLLSETAGRLLASDNPPAIVEELCTTVMEHLECDCFFNYLADETRQLLELNACAGVQKEIAQTIARMNYGQAVCGCVAQNAERMIVQDVQHDLSEPVTLIRSLGIRACACHPLIGPGGKLIGTLSFGTRSRDRFTEQEVSMMKTMADLTATAMFRMRMEQSLRESRLDLERAQAVAHIGSWRLKIRQDVLLWSDETYRIFGIPAGTPMTYERFMDAVYPDDRRHVDESWQAAMRGAPYDCEHRIVADGVVRWVREKAHLEFDADGTLVSGFGTAQDITRQKTEAEELRQAQQALYNGSQLLESVLDNTHVLVACMDRQFNFIRVNKAYAQADDREVEFFHGKNHFDLYPNPQNEAIFRHAVETGEPYLVYSHQFDYAANPDRGPSWWDWSLVPIRDQHGQVSRLVLTLANVTQQKKSQDLHERMMRRQAALLSASEEILEADRPEALLETISRTARIITQARLAVAESVYQGRVFTSMAVCSTDPPGHRLADLKQHLRRILTEHGQTLCLTKEQLRTHPLGAYLPLKDVDINGLLAAPLVNRAGQVNGLILLSEKESGAFTEDDEAELRQLAAISSLALQHLEARDQLKQERDQLEDRVQKRTEDLERTVITLGEEVLQRVKVESDLHATNIELQRRAERLSQMASELTVAEHRERYRLAQVLHDHLQQLLVAAKIELSTAVRKITHHEPRRLLENVMGTLKQSIDASRTLTVELYPPILHEAGLIGGLEWLVRWMQEKHRLTVELDKGGDVNIKREDICILLFQSIRELLFNTVKHSGVREARVEVRRKGDFVEVRIADQGKGFDVARVFERTDNQAGGFGLFSIRERLTSMGGRLEIVSAPDAGSTFVLTAPADLTLKPEELVASKRKIEDIKSNALMASTARAGKIRILLVDDHTIMRRGLATLLRQEPDMQVVGEAADGAEAIELAQQLMPDVILMDFSLPGMTGAEATRIICTKLPQVRVIGLSMFDEQDRASTMIGAGASAYASKSESPVILLTAIRAATCRLRDLKPANHKDAKRLDPDPGGKPA